MPNSVNTAVADSGLRQQSMTRGSMHKAWPLLQAVHVPYRLCRYSIYATQLERLLVQVEATSGAGTR